MVDFTLRFNTALAARLTRYSTFGSQGRKSLRLCLAELRIRRFDTIAEASELSDHLRRALLLRLFGNRGAPFFVTNSLVQNLPDQAAKTMGNHSDRLIVSQARHISAIEDGEEASFVQYARSGSDRCTASTSPLESRPRRSEPLVS